MKKLLAAAALAALLVIIALYARRWAGPAGSESGESAPQLELLATASR